MGLILHRLKVALRWRWGKQEQPVLPLRATMSPESMQSPFVT